MKTIYLLKHSERGNYLDVVHNSYKAAIQHRDELALDETESKRVKNWLSYVPVKFIEADDND